MFEREDGSTDADLLGVAVASAALVALAVVPALAPLGLLALPLLLVAPGYALVAACYPGRAIPADAAIREGPDDPRLSLLGRLALSLAGSAAVVAAVGLPLALLGRFAALPVVAGVSALTLVLLAVAWRRRREHPDPFGVDPTAASSRLSAWSHGTRTDAVLTAACVVALVATGGVVYADATATNPGPTSAALLGPADANATDTSTLTAEETTAYRVAVSNPAVRPANATVVAVLETYGPNATAGTTLPDPRQRDAVGRQTRVVDANATAVVAVPVRPPERAANARLVFLVYRGSVPADPTIETADAELHRWIAVEPGDGGANESAAADAARASVAVPTGVAP